MWLINKAKGLYRLSRLNSRLLVSSFRTKSSYLDSATNFVNSNGFISSSP